MSLIYQIIDSNIIIMITFYSLHRLICHILGVGWSMKFLIRNFYSFVYSAVKLFHYIDVCKIINFLIQIQTLELISYKIISNHPLKSFIINDLTERREQNVF